MEITMKSVVVVLVLLAISTILPIANALKANPKVIIVGAGMSGLSAAKTLSDAGIKDILILEATDRIGGRVKKTKFAGLSVEMGANWVEGVGSTDTINPIWPMAKKLKLKTFYSDWSNISANIYKQYVPSTPLEMAIDFSKYDFESAESPRVTSLMTTIPMATFTNFGEDSYFVADPNGYESVVIDVAKQVLTTRKDGLITDPRLKLNQVVTVIRHSPSGVIVKTEDGSVYRADYVIVSVSIGVLQSKLIDFQPDLPMWKVLALYQFDMAIYTKIFLKFPSRFWPTGNGTQFFLYAHERRGYYTYWQQFEHEYPGSNVLMVTVTDDESRRVEQQPDSETKAEIMQVLKNMFGKNIPEATDILVPKWWSNKFYRGTYSNWPVGVDRFEHDQLRAPVGKIYFTGEHTSAPYTGFLHGAYLSGIDSANQMIGCVKKGMCKVQVMPKGT
ncbi:hypothetical protein AQUCO_02500315v1 [Aquilegia coerulea]|uniref:Amine oxidase domain-containing protein n=1 Tax=Aquilegia coerulea TaxID=218851 RepID=A0A2G5DAG7_AQUCA|nr:hypothetical protein AQUCO_02500315v1 [Aquilegia coerulea]